MALAGFAEEHRFDGAAGAQRFFDQAHAFDADEAGLRRQSAFQREAKFLEPAIIAASDRGRRDGSSRGASGFARCSHHKGSVTNLSASRLISAIRSGVAASLGDSFVLFFCYPALDSAKTAESCWAKFFADPPGLYRCGELGGARFIAGGCGGVVASTGMAARFGAAITESHASSLGDFRATEQRGFPQYASASP